MFLFLKVIFYILCCIFIFINLFSLRIKYSPTPSFSNLEKHEALVNIIIPTLENQNHYQKLESDRLLGKAYAK